MVESLLQRRKCLTKAAPKGAELQQLLQGMPQVMPYTKTGAVAQLVGSAKVIEAPGFEAVGLGACNKLFQFKGKMILVWRAEARIWPLAS